MHEFNPATYVVIKNCLQRQVRKIIKGEDGTSTRTTCQFLPFLAFKRGKERGEDIYEGKPKSRWDILKGNERRQKTRTPKFSSKSDVHSSPAAASSITNLKVLQLCFELLDSTVSHLQVLVQTIPLGDQMLLPLPEPRLFGLDLLRKLLS